MGIVELIKNKSKLLLNPKVLAYTISRKNPNPLLTSPILISNKEAPAIDFFNGMFKRFF
jgi:hypothetical protein